MNDSLSNEISQLKEHILKKTAHQSSIEKILQKKIDRDFPLNIPQLSETELDYEIYKRTRDLNENLFYIKLKFNECFEINKLLSFKLFNNKIVKFFFFPFYILFFVPTRIGVFFESFIILNQIIPYRQKKYNQKIRALEDQINNLKSQLEETNDSF